MESLLSADIQDSTRDQHDVAALLVDGLHNSPARHMAPEIMSEIFLHCLPTSDYPRPYVREAPLVLGRICRLWRMIVLSTPRLWAKLSMESERGAEIDAMVMKEWITRSGSCPLSLNLAFDELGEPSFIWPFSNIMDEDKALATLLPYAMRWENIKLTIPKASILLVAVALRHGTPLLRSLQVSTIVDSKPVSVIVDISSALLLHRLEIFSRVLVHFGENIRHNMRTLRLEYCASMATCFRCLELCPMLESFSVTFIDPEAHLPVGSGVLKLPKLLDLSIRAHRTPINFAYTDPSPFLCHLQVPALKSLLLDIHLRHTPDSWPHLYELLERSKAPLEKLHIDAAPLFDEGLIDCLVEVPSLKSFTLAKDPITTSFMAALTRPPGTCLGDEDTHLCPHLNEMTLITFEDIPDEAVASMICSRWINRRCDDESNEDEMAVLRSLTVLGEDYKILLQNAEIAKCIEEGFILRVEERE